MSESPFWTITEIYPQAPCGSSGPLTSADQLAFEEQEQAANRMTRMVNSYKRTSSPRSPTNSGEIFTPAHEENVRFIHESWQFVLREIRSTQNSERNDRGPQEYVEKNPNPNLHSFVPVDLSELKKRNTQDSKKS
ncbi:mapk-regulated corepressor-interacting protein 1 isoform X2 [Synchiropus splendidus]|uniref:mapk-regulated corepressor-interacting protein 1 isoform X2 n=2 Tax=Synchiropus splendidus TaxID=270530 RepID=UPI00237DE1ED|nr:mapk-regulated corepressor-interacting protein 1 isoform X2 [Synchiropus splendidus]